MTGRGTTRRLAAALVAVALAASGGCKSKKTAAEPDAPLTIEQWQSLPPETKYTVATFERLREGNPHLQDTREWEKFHRTVVKPGMAKELPRN